MRISFNTSNRAGKGITGKIIFSLFGLFFAGVGILLVRGAIDDVREVKSMQAWPSVPCEITQCETEDHGEDFRLRLAYSYSVSGEDYTSFRYGLHEYFTSEEIGPIKAAEKRFATGTETTCHTNPDHPSDAVLVLPRVSEARKAVVFTLLFPAFGLFFAIIPWLFMGRGRRTAGTSKKTGGPKVFLILFGLIFAGAGTAMLKPLLITPLQKTSDAKSWTSVSATVVSSKVKSHDSDDGTTYSPYIAYRYEVDGEEYFGDQYTFMGGSSSGYDSKANIVRAYPKGHAFDIYVNPNNPAESVIKRDAGASLFICAFPLIFIAVGLIVIIAAFRMKKPTLDLSQRREHVIQLESKSPGKKTVGLFLFTAVWLGIVYFLAITDAPLMFPVIFGVFGLILCIASIHAALGLTNPRPTAELTPGNLHPGINAALRWRLGGKVEKLRSMKITLECLRVTTQVRQSGNETKTSVVKTPIYSEELLNAERQTEFVQGALQFPIPADQPASRPGNDNGIEWRLTYHGDIPRWPDMKEEFTFIVYPEEA